MINRNKIRCKVHLRYVAENSCPLCERWTESVVPHHLLRSGGKGMATKSCDGETIPLCHYHHQALHLYGDEIEFFEMSGFEYGEILEMCRVLCEESPSKRIKDAAILQNFERYIAS